MGVQRALREFRNGSHLGAHLPVRKNNLGRGSEHPEESNSVCSLLEAHNSLSKETASLLGTLVPSEPSRVCYQ